MPAFLAFTTICKYAPPLFEHSAIESLRAFVKSSRVLSQSEKNSIPLKTLENAHNLPIRFGTTWNAIPGCFSATSARNSEWFRKMRSTSWSCGKSWVSGSAPEGKSYRLLPNAIDTEVEGSCPNCGVRGKGRKELFFRLIVCEKCSTEGYYHIEYLNPGR